MIIAIIFLLSALLIPAQDLTRQELFATGQGGYAHYRIPGIIVTSKGTILAYAEARKSLRGDWGTNRHRSPPQAPIEVPPGRPFG